ncbi:acyl-CoA thioester hydrolase YbgC [bacterium BMS3Bbin12]|nr:acyl-CoA thioester hydrolase YbgC [bacterium BMS3Abin12]GBE47167.1 acyl-CoA thioester hydrolase YbgC [bacterium BMS3Bbin12]GBE49566.1 acyl-CoA thioester hydrolase YbgC [bacterium BMS3Bbin13]
MQIPVTIVNVFVWPVRVYYEDTDAGGIVYYANYLKFMERARTEWLRALGFEQDRLREREGVIFAVRSVCLDFIKPARFNDLLDVTVQPVRKRPASLVLDQEVRAGRGPSRSLCRGRVRIACLDARTLNPRALPRSLLLEIPGE